jgi:hypothetical protein
MSETSGTNNKSEQLFKKKSLNEQQQQESSLNNNNVPHTLPRVYMIKVLDKKEQEKEDYKTILIGGGGNNNNNDAVGGNNTNTNKMKNKQANSLLIEDMDEQQQQQQNTARSNKSLVGGPSFSNKINKNKLINSSDSLLNGSFGGDSNIIGISKELSVVQVNEKLLNRGIQTDHHHSQQTVLNGGVNNSLTGTDDHINKSGSNILLLSMSHSSSLNSSRVTSSADLSSKLISKLK